MFYRVSFIIAVCSIPLQTYATPLDFNGDSYSDPSIVQIDDGLNWFSSIDDEIEPILSSFGESGEHLVPGQYTGKKTIPATLDSSGTWMMSNNSSVSFGEAGALYIGGADFNGDNKTDFAYSTRACQNKQSRFHIQLNDESSRTSFKNSKGTYFKFYYDSDDNGQDDFCTLKPLKNKQALTKKFRVICKSALTGRKTKSFPVGRVNEQPHPIKVANGQDLLLIPQEKKSDTVLKFFTNKGKIQSKISIPQQGTLVVGNFSSTASEQVAIVDDEIAYVYDPLEQATTTMSFPEGIPYDEINIVHFEETDSCFCTSKVIQRNQSCTQRSLIQPNPEEPTKITIPDNCDNPPQHLSSNDGFKCIASATRGGSVVCLLPYQFTWAPHKSVTDHHSNTFSCNKNDTHFSKVELVLDSGEKIDLSYSGCHNYVATTDGPMGRQHFRNENFRWSSIKNRVQRIEMTKDSQKSCLRF